MIPRPGIRYRRREHMIATHHWARADDCARQSVLPTWSSEQCPWIFATASRTR
jgi:hypothetical protein